VLILLTVKAQRVTKCNTLPCNKLGAACRKSVGDQRLYTGFWCVTFREEFHLEDLGVDGGN
jgi:hypothetical protein